MAHRVKHQITLVEKDCKMDFGVDGMGDRKRVKTLWVEIDTTIHGLTLVHIFHQVLLSFSFPHPLKLVHCLGVPP